MTNYILHTTYLLHFADAYRFWHPSSARHPNLPQCCTQVILVLLPLLQRRLLRLYLLIELQLLLYLSRGVG